MARLEAVANVALRVPGLALLDLLYRWDAAALGDLLRPRRGDPPLLRPPALRGAYCLGHLLCLVVLMLPVRSLVKLYLHLLTALLLGAGHTVAGDCVRRELEYGFQGAVYSDPAALGRFATALAGQLCLCVLCSLLMRSRQPWLFGAPLLPVLARLCGLPLHALPVLDTFAAILTALEVLYVLGSHVLVPFQLAAAACREVVQALEVYRLVALGVSLWSQLAIPLLFLIFWLVLFSLRLSSFLTSSSSPLAQQGLLFVLLTRTECCSTPYSLIGLTFTVSYLALGVLDLCKFCLLGFGAFQNGNVMHRGVTEGVTLLLLALRTGLLDLQILQWTFLLGIILFIFIVVTSTLQSMIEIADPIVLALGASRNRSPWKHFRGVSTCLFLLVFPCFMAYKIARFFHLDFWLLILVSSCMLTSLQVDTKLPVGKEPAAAWDMLPALQRSTSAPAPPPPAALRRRPARGLLLRLLRRGGDPAPLSKVGRWAQSHVTPAGPGGHRSQGASMARPRYSGGHGRSRRRHPPPHAWHPAPPSPPVRDEATQARGTPPPAQGAVVGCETQRVLLSRPQHWAGGCRMEGPMLSPA
ncbi:RING finger protein 145-like isoform X2 [Aquila chrysaetos chrysaetos]|uniref:RING finger protein 145-like isoform X2 n=1 Tax=Aquila chrysaetos chrysaetos TaxID=223781 RepID=UPI001B7D31D0|nr:RING finger protein 145-like isoform X2 [Aquila chrysaetos chrysaetos]